MQLIIRRWTGLLCAMTATTAIAIMPHKTPPLPNYDRRAEQPSRAPAVAEQAHNTATAKLAARVSRLKVTRDEITGTPKLISSADGFLTGPRAQGRAVTAQALRGLEQDPHRSVKAFLNEHAALFGQDASLLSNARIKREFVTPHSGMRTVIWEQQLDGIPVFEGLLTGHITKNEELVNLSSHFIPNSAQAANAGSGKPAADRAKPRLDAPAAIVRAAADIEVAVKANEIAVSYEAEEERPNVVHYGAPGLNGRTEASLVWLPLDGTKLRLCWQIILTSRMRGEMYRVLVDAEDGAPLLRHCLTSYISEATYRVYTSDSPSPFSPGHPTPLVDQPPFVPRVLVTTMALNTNASPSGWINDGVNETRGNNVDAHLDRDANDSPDLPRPQGSPNRVFDFPMSPTQVPSVYTNASVTQLFYWNNWMHDKLYELGFTEAAGNFQVNNFGRGGLGNDAVAADAQDGAGFNNANMSTPPDGSPARMQMFLFDGPTPDRDGDFDAEVVLHEYTHGLSNRRVGGGVGISTLQAAGMGEGWSDFYGLSLLSESGDDIHANYAAGGYLTFQLAGLLENYYFGIRRYPYSTDMSKNPLTFKDIDPGQASGHVGVPLSPIFGGAPANEVHNQGEVWCVTLWEARANLIEKHGFEIGNGLILQLVTDGMNLSPANPNFLESRDAILEADRVLTGGANFNELWRAFAKRGMGFSATSPPSTTTSGVRESFDVPDDLLVLPTGSLLMIGPVGGPFTPTGQIYSLTNVSTNNVIWSAMNSQTWLQLSNTSGSLAPGALGTTVTGTLTAAAELLPLGVYTDQITFTNHVSGRTQSRSVTLAVGQPDHFTEQFEGDNDLDFLMLTFTPDASASHYTLCREVASALPVDPRDGKALALGDDMFTTIQLAGSARVTLYGKSTNIFFIGSNGYITFDFGDSSLSDSLTAHFALPRIAALMTDLNPAAGGTVSWQQSGDRVVLTFLNVPLYGSVNNTNTFQIEMFYDGRIRITYLRVDIAGGVAGLSRGEGLPPAFRESDFSAYPTCSARFLVSFASTVTEGQGVLEGTVSLPTAATSNVVATLRSSNPDELTLPATVKIGTGETSAPFSATIVDDARVDGSQRVTITVSKPGYTSHNAVTTVHDNEQTELTLILPSGVVEGAAFVQGQVAAAQNVDAPVTVLLSVSDPSVQLPGAVTIPTGSDSAAFPIAALNNSQIDGNRLATISAHVENWPGTTGSLQILDDEMTQLSVILPASVSEAVGTLLQQGLVTLPGILTTNLVVTLSSSDPSRVSVPSMVTITAGQLSNRFDLTITDNALAAGPQQVTITAQASGWSAGESSLTVVDDEFPPTPFLPSPVHLSSNNPVTVDLSWHAGDGELMVNGGFETGDLTGWMRNSPPGSGFIVNDGLLDPSGPDGPLPPFEGSFSVLTIQTGPGTHELSQSVSLPGGGATLNWAHRVRNHGGVFAANQNFRVEIREGASVLAVPFSTQPDDALLQEWTEHSFDLTPFAGRIIDVVFVEHDELGFFNAHVDAVSLLAASPQLTTYDVYFGTNAALGPANLLGSTTTSMWDLPDLAPLTTYYWQIVARRLGTTVGPVWQFTTRGVDQFVWEPISSPQQVNVAFPATIVASDEFGTPVTNFSGTVFLAAVSQGTTNPVNPSVINNFVNGRWSGSITVADPLADVMLLAHDAEGYSGLSAPINVTALNDLSINAVANPNPVISLRSLALTLTAHNSGPATANSVIVSNRLPGNFAFVSVTASQGSCSNVTGTVLCDLGSLSGSQTATVTINVTATGVGSATNLTSITRAEVDGVLSNNSAQQVTTILPVVTLSLAQLSANENAGAFGLLCQLSQPSAAPISFDFLTESGTAVAGLDFPATNGTVTVPAGTTSQFVFLGLLNDTSDETNETFALVLTNVVNAVPQSTRYTLSILDDDAPPSVSIADASVTEGNAGTSEARFQVQLSAMSGANVSVNYNSTAGTAAAGSDFIATNGTVNFPAGLTNAEIVISVRGDLLDENTEMFNINLFGPTNATLLDSLGAGTIIDDDAPPSLRVLDANFVEGQANSTQFVTVELSAVSGLSVTVGYSTSNGTAIAGSDFTAAAGTLAFAPGTLSRTIPITVLGDTNDEGRERFSMVLSNALGALIADGVGLITLLNDDAPAGTADSFAWNVISSPQYLGAPFPVTITARDFSGNPATNFAGPVSIMAIAQQPVAIAPATSGAFVDGVWSGNMSVMQPVAGVRLRATALADQTGESNPFDVLATNDISLSMSAAPNPVTLSDTLRFAISVTNSGPDLASGLVLSNTLPAGAQFVSAVPSSGTCSNSANTVVCDLGSLAATQTDITVEIVVLPQAVGSMTNVATVYRTEADAYFPNNTATAAAEVLPTPSITISNVVVLEPDTTSTNARFRIFLSHSSSRDVSMEFATVPLSAGLADFVPRTGVLTIAAGTTSAIVDVTVLGDLLDETNETFGLVLSHPTNAVLVSATGYADIQDQDLAPLITIDDLALGEGNPPESPSATLTISLSKPSGLPVSLRAATQNSTAVAGFDYLATNAVVYLPPGVTNATFTVSVLPDFLDENDENIFVNLSSPTNATLADVRGVVTLIDDDSSPAILVSDLSVTEGNSGSTTGIVRVALSQASGRTVSVQFSMQDGTAAGITDYSPGVGTLVFAPGTTNLSFPVQIFGDLLIEETEHFFINFFNVTNSIMPDPSIVISIINDDGLPGALDSFSWAAMDSPRRADTPFSATAFARDRFGDIATSFTGTATLHARSAQAEVEIGTGAVSWHYPLASFFHDSRCQVIYLASELQRAQQIAGISLNVTAPPGQLLNNWTIRMKHTTRSNYLGVGFWESGGWTIVYRQPKAIAQTGWVSFPFVNVFNYNGSNHLMIDFSFDNGSYTFDGSCLSTLTPQPRAMTFRSDSANGDPINWSSAPVPIVSSRVPNIRIQPVTTSLPVTPATIGFSSGIWTGNVTVQVPGTNVQLIAEDSLGRIGLSAAFDVLPADTAINLRITRSEDLVQLSWDSIAGQSYRVDFTETLDNLSWEPLAAAAVAVGPISTASDVLNPGAQRFYRVIELP